MLQGGNGGRGGNGGDGGSGSGAYETTFCIGNGICTTTGRWYPGDGGNAGSGGNGGSGGAGLYSVYGRQINLYGTIAQGGDGGSGGTGGGGGPPGSSYGYNMPDANNGNPGTDGSGGSGGAGIEVDATSGGSTVITISSDSRAQGGKGGDAGGTTYGSSAGTGGDGVHVTGSADISVGGTVIGGAGGNINGNGSGATGGAGIFVDGRANITVLNGGQVTGGLGGSGAADSGAFGGSGGSGISVTGAGTSLTIAGEVRGGGSQGFQPGPNGAAIVLSGSGNTVELHNGYQITGNVLAGTNATLIFGGDQNASFDLSGLGGQYRGFSIFNKTGASTWTLSGTPTSFTGDTGIYGGTLVLASGARLTSGNAIIGSALGSQAGGLVTGSGSVWTAGSMSVSGYGNDTLTIQNGGSVKVSGDLTIGSGPNSIAGSGDAVTVDGAGSRLSVNGSTYVGGALMIENGGVVDSRQMQIGFGDTGSATVTVTGAGSSLKALASIGIAGFSSNSLTVADGASAGIVGDSGSFVIGKPRLHFILRIGVAKVARIGDADETIERGDVGGGEAVDGPEFEHHVDDVVRGAATRMSLRDYAGAFDRQRLPERQCVPTAGVRASEQIAEALRGLQDIEAPGQAGAAECGRLDCVARRHAGVERLGRRAELALDPGRQADRHAHRPRHGGGVEADEPGDARRGADRAAGRCRMPADSVVRGIDADADGGLSLQPDEIGIDQCPPVDVHRRGGGEQRRDKYRRSVADRGMEVVVIVERVCGGAVDQRRDRCGRPSAADHRAFAARS